jgi:pSer/pThr/pTyr-binding forkhead associated (FHA) protein
LVRVADPSVSKTHFAFGVDEQGAWVLDRNSKNGCAIVDGDRQEPCPPGQKIRVRAGMTVLFGARQCAVIDEEVAG